MSKKHRLEVYRWVEGQGILEKTHHEFEKLEEALEFGHRTTAHRFKIYNENNELVHTGVPQPTDSYA